MSKEKSTKKPSFSFGHPFFVVLGGIVIAYGGYLFGVWVYQLFH